MKRLVTAGLLLMATTAFAGEVMKQGAPLSDTKPVSVSAIIENPEAYKEKPVIVEGVVTTVCADMGCWMQLATAADSKESIRVKFKNHAFFVPTETKGGVKARAEGLTKISVLSKEDADHAASEGAMLKRNADGTANEVSFIATGVELHP